MATKTTAETNFYQNWVDSQKKMIDNMTESASKFTKGTEVTEAFSKGSDLYKTWLDNQLSFMNEQTEKMNDPKSNLTPEQVAATTKEWMDSQMKMTREFVEFSMSTMKTYFDTTLKSFPMLNGNAEKMKNMFNDNMSLFSEWNATLSKSYDEMMKTFTPGTTKDAMAGMFNMTQTYTKFAELWAPFIKSLQEKTFQADVFKNMMNPVAFKEMFDKMFSFSANPFASITNMWNMNNFANTDWMKNMTNMMNPASNPFSTWMNNNPFNTASNSNDWIKMFGMNTNPMAEWMKMFNTNTASNPMNEWTKMFGMNTGNPIAEMMKNWNTFNSQNNWMKQFQMPDSSEMFSNVMSNYNNMYESTQQLFAPMFRMMTPNATKESMDAFSSLANKMIQFNIRFAEMQYMTYTTGSKAMQKVAERMQEITSKGEDFKGMNALYTEWMNTSDKVFVKLFESEAYSKVQAEVASLQHNIKIEAEAIMEKMMAKIPVVTRTEMNDNYKTMHDLKKRVNELEKALEAKEAKKSAK
jgi:hypothetical protein